MAAKPIIVLESGVWSDAGSQLPVRLPDGSIGTATTSETYQAAYVGKLLSRGLAASLAGVLWYSLRDQTGDVKRGFVDAVGNRKESFEAFRQATTRLTGATYFSPLATRDVSGGTPEGYLFSLPTGGSLGVVWAVGTETAAAGLTADLVGGNLRAYDYLGNRLSPIVLGDAIRVTVGNTPVYLLSGREQLRTIIPLGPRLSNP